MDTVALEYLAGRGVKNAALKMGWQGGQFKKINGLWYPVFTIDGQPLTLNGKPSKRWKNISGGPYSGENPKYTFWNIRDEGRIIQPYYFAKNFLGAVKMAGGEAWLSGGDVDTLTYLEADIYNVFNLWGDKNFPDTFATDLETWGVTTLKYPFDLDDSGIESVVMIAAHLQAAAAPIEFIPLLWPGEMESKLDANKVWQGCSFKVQEFEYILANLEPFDYSEYAVDDTEDMFTGRQSAPSDNPFKRDLPGEFYAQIEAKLGVQKYDRAGWSNKVICPFHEDSNPSAGWHKDRHILHCFVCHGTNQHALAKEVGAALNLDWKTFITTPPPVRNPNPVNDGPPPDAYDDTEGDSDNTEELKSSEYEARLIALFMQANETFYEIDPLGLELFELPRHKLIMQAIEALVMSGDPFDLEGVTLKLEEMGLLADVGAGYLTHLDSLAVKRTHLELYANKVRENAYRRRLKSQGRALITLADTPGDLSTLAAQYEAVAGSDSIGGEEFKIETSKAAVARHMARTQHILEHGGEVGYGTGLLDLDQHVRIYKGNLGIIAARPGMGKTAFLLKLLLMAGRKYGPVALVSMEMTSDEIISRLISMVTYLNVTKVIEGKLSDAPDSKYGGLSEIDRYLAGARRIGDLPLLILDKPAVTPSQAMAFFRRCKRQYNAVMGGVDYLQLMSAGGLYRDNRTQQVAYCARQLKEVAGALDMPIWAASQTSRAGHNKNPSLDTLAESDELGKAANVIIGLRRMNINNPQDHTARAFILKQRNGAAGLAIDLAYLPYCALFGDAG